MRITGAKVHKPVKPGSQRSNISSAAVLIKSAVALKVTNQGHADSISNV